MTTKPSGHLALKEIVRLCKQRGFPVPLRTLQYYQSLRLLPPPSKVVGSGGRGVYGNYNPSIINRIGHIEKLKIEGLTLEQIAHALKEEMKARGNAIIDRLGRIDPRICDQAEILEHLPCWADDQSITAAITKETEAALRCYWAARTHIMEEVREAVTMVTGRHRQLRGKLLDHLEKAISSLPAKQQGRS